MSIAAVSSSSPLDWDEQWYVSRYPDIAEAIAAGRLVDPLQHYLEFGRNEGRFPCQAAEAARQQADPIEEHPRSQVAIGNFLVPLDWPVQGEVQKTFRQRLVNGFFHRYMSGQVILDIGYKGGHSNAVPIFPHAIWVDLDYPGYDGITLPFGNESVDTVFASHVLEHVPNSVSAVRDWFRVIKPGGFIVCIVPHQYLYERKRTMPSNWSREHVRFYTPATLLRDFEEALEPNAYRVRHLADNDGGYEYDLSPEHHAAGCYEIEIAIEKITPPSWKLD
jgi:SAM-dependent methyltransferase